ncbi:DNA cytosine methyltransferase [Rhizobium sp. 2TAF27]|uniref:DNA cytosine methyltransferase n=1 Tax=Rhizobium sp. 2TAF27 TaxID=3233013 RepID=UPI003F979429
MRTVELFCGAGGMSRGLIDAGFDVVQAYDAWPVAVENYRRNIGPHVRQADLSDLLSIIPEIARLEPDLICGGPPCQDYSLAGVRQEGARASLTVAFAIIVAAVRPAWFIMENVTQAAKSSAWLEARSILKKAGYGLSESKLNASYYQTAQSRRRLFVCGRLGERDGFLQSAIAGAASARPMTLRDLFGQSVPEGINFPTRMPDRRSVWGAGEPAPTIRCSLDRPIPSTYVPHPNDAALIENGFVFSRPVRNSRGVRSVDEPFPTVTRTSWERPAPKYLGNPHPDDPVPAGTTARLTREQASRIQGFPGDWQWIATAQRDILQMIANAVPAPLAKAIGEVILMRERGETAPAIEGRFLDWLCQTGCRRATARNVKANVGRARRLLGGRTFADVAVEIAALEAVNEFAALSKGTKSDLRQALRLLHQFEEAKRSKSRRPRAVPSQAPEHETEQFAKAA